MCENSYRDRGRIYLSLYTKYRRMPTFCCGPYMLEAGLVQPRNWQREQRISAPSLYSVKVEHLRRWASPVPLQQEILIKRELLLIAPLGNCTTVATCIVKTVEPQGWDSASTSSVLISRKGDR